MGKSLLALTLGVFFLTNPVHALILDRLEATVNSSVVLLSDVVDFRKTVALRTQLDPLFAQSSLAKKGSQLTDSEIVHFLLDERLIIQEFPIGDSDVEQEINSIQATNRLTRAALKGFIQSQGFKFEDYYELIRSSLSKRNLIDRDIRTKVVISDEDIQNHLNIRGSDHQVPGALHLKLILITPKNFKSAAAAKKTLESWLTEIRSGKSFEDVAKSSSEHPSATSGGDLGFVSEEDLAPGLRRAVQGLKTGQISKVNGDAKEGFFIVKLEGVQTRPDEKLQKLREDVRNQLAGTEYQRQITLWLERHRAKAYIHLAVSQ
jgi:peptidyl-prolyl cis-trans isomerase SurA